MDPVGRTKALKSGSGEFQALGTLQPGLTGKSRHGQLGQGSGDGIAIQAGPSLGSIELGPFGIAGTPREGLQVRSPEVQGLDPIHERIADKGARPAHHASQCERFRIEP